MTPRPKALIVNFPSNPTTAMRRPALPRAPRRARPPVRLPPHPRPRLRRHRLRRLQAAQRPRGPRRQRRRRRVLHPVQELQHARLARRIHGRQPASSSPPSPASRATSTTAPSRPSRSRPSLALEGPQECVAEICETYRRRRNVLVEGLNKLGWQVALPKATMFVWAQIPEAYAAPRLSGVLQALAHRSQSSRHRPASASATTATATSASPSSRTKSAPARRSAASSRCSQRAWYRLRVARKVLPWCESQFDHNEPEPAADNRQ